MAMPSGARPCRIGTLRATLQLSALGLQCSVLHGDLSPYLHTHIYIYIHIYIYTHTNKIYGFEVQRTKAAGSPLAARMKALKADSAKQAGGEGFGAWFSSLDINLNININININIYIYIYIECVTECRPVFFE